MVTGKGGVGKSTVTALLASASAASGARTLVCELNARERIPGLFGQGSVGSRITPIAPNLFCVNIEPRAALEEYALMKLRLASVYRVVFENPLVQRFVEFVPGMNDLLYLGKAFNHERETDSHGRPRWDRIVIDAPATGHGITFFRLPKVILDYVPRGNMHDEASAMWSLLTDPQKTAVHLVSLPEELPVAETVELHRILSEQFKMPMGVLWKNQVPTARLTGQARVDFLALPEPKDNSAVSAVWEAARIREGRVEQAIAQCAALEALGLPTVTLPLVYGLDGGPALLSTLLTEARAQGLLLKALS